jgi:RimJ/RimL family protein N-acetyltransferase
VLSGRLVRLRPIEVEDLPFLTDLANHPVVRANVVGWDWPVSLTGQAEWLRAANSNRLTRRLTVTTHGGEPIGLTGLWDIDWHNQSALTAVKLMPGLAPKGAGSDTIMLVMAWAFYEVGLRRLHSTILDFNEASLGAYVRKCGWRLEGRECEAVFRKGAWHDLVRVATLRHDHEDSPGLAEYVKQLYPDGRGTVPSQPPVRHELSQVASSGEPA